MTRGKINKYFRIASAGCLAWDTCIEKNFGCSGKECIFYEAPNKVAKEITEAAKKIKMAYLWNSDGYDKIVRAVLEGLIAQARIQEGLKMHCIQCNKEYRAYDEDDGTYREHFCSKECETKCIKQYEDFVQRESDFALSYNDPSSPSFVTEGATGVTPLPSRLAREVVIDILKTFVTYHCLEQQCYVNKVIIWLEGLAQEEDKKGIITSTAIKWPESPEIISEVDVKRIEHEYLVKLAGCRVAAVAARAVALKKRVQHANYKSFVRYLPIVVGIIVVALTVLAYLAGRKIALGTM